MHILVPKNSLSNIWRIFQITIITTQDATVKTMLIYAVVFILVCVNATLAIKGQRQRLDEDIDNTSRYQRHKKSRKRTSH